MQFKLQNTNGNYGTLEKKYIKELTSFETIITVNKQTEKSNYHETEYDAKINIKTLEDLISLVKNTCKEIVIFFDGDEWRIELYDNYRE